MTRTVAEVAKRFVGTYLDTDPDPKLEELYAAKVTRWHNFDPAKHEVRGRDIANQMVTRRALIRSVIPDFRVEDFKLHIAESAFIIVQTSAGTLPDGTPFRIPACVIWEVSDGQIVTVNSVGDSQQRRALEEVLDAA